MAALELAPQILVAPAERDDDGHAVRLERDPDRALATSPTPQPPPETRTTLPSAESPSEARASGPASPGSSNAGIVRPWQARTGAPSR